ncbi:hypothetical protein LMG9449_1697 [Lactococcus lactis subsp. lactis]|uniref:Uncharacterized protein n=1 Tax=Lactococcus lactis subsp. lactis TaxID=1360 RepID=A0A0V8DUM1_LACLL|nr:hypothetical protein LMG9449_1697 [Lactococcus lactis subsp. lactis]
MSKMARNFYLENQTQWLKIHLIVGLGWQNQPSLKRIQ